MRPVPFRVALRAAITAAMLLASACVRSSPPEERAPAARAVGSDWSVYDLDSKWTDQTGAPTHLAQLRGAPRVVAMMYTHCTATCPIVIAEMKQLEAVTPPGVSFLLVSLDQDRDTPGRLAAYAAEHGLSATRWTLLSGTDDAVRELAAALDIRYRRLSPTELAHSNTITLLDANGGIARQQTALEPGADIARRATAMIH